MEEYFGEGTTLSTILGLEKELQTLKLETFMTSSFNEAVEQQFPLLELKMEYLKGQRDSLMSQKTSEEETVAELMDIKNTLYSTLLKKKFETESLCKLKEIERQDAENKLNEKVQEKKRKMIAHIRKLQSTEMVKRSIQAKEDASAEEAKLQVEKLKLKKLNDKHNHLKKLADAEDSKSIVKLAMIIREHGCLKQKWDALKQRETDALSEIEKIKEAKIQLKNNQESEYYNQIKNEFVDKAGDNDGNLKVSFKDPNDFPQLTLCLQKIKSSTNKDALKKICFSESRKKRIYENTQFDTPKSSKKQKRHHRTPLTEGYKRAQGTPKPKSVSSEKGSRFLKQIWPKPCNQKKELQEKPKPEFPEVSKKIKIAPFSEEIISIGVNNDSSSSTPVPCKKTVSTENNEELSQKVENSAVEPNTVGGSDNFSFIHLKQQQLANMSTPKTKSTSKRKMSKMPEGNSLSEPKKMKENKIDEILAEKEQPVADLVENRNAEKKNVLSEIKPKPNIVEMILVNSSPIKELKTPVAKPNQEKKQKSMSSGRKGSRLLQYEESKIFNVKKKTDSKRKSVPAEIGDTVAIKTPKVAVINKPTNPGTKYDKENLGTKTPVFSSSEDVDSEKLRKLVEEASNSKKTAEAGKDKKEVTETKKIDAVDDSSKPKIISDELIEPAMTTSIDNISSDFEAEINFDSKSVDYDQLFNMDTGNFDSSSLNFSDEFKTDGVEFNFSPKSSKSGTSNNVDFGGAEDKAATDMDIEHMSLF